MGTASGGDSDTMNNFLSPFKNYAAALISGQNRSPQKAVTAVTNKRYLFWAAVTLVGFVLAEIISLTVPNTQEVNDLAYRAALLGLIALYFGIAVFSWFDDARRAKFVSRAPFRFA